MKLDERDPHDPYDIYDPDEAYMPFSTVWKALSITLIFMGIVAYIIYEAYY